MNSLKQMVYYAVAIVCLKGVSFVMLPVLTGNMSQEQFGELNILVSLSAVLSIIFACGSAELLFRYSQKQNDQTLQPALVSSLLWLSLCIAMCLIVLALGTSSRLTALLPVYVEPRNLALLMVSLACNLLLVVPLALFRIQQKARQFMLLTVAQGLGQAGLSYLFLSNGLNVFGVMLAGVISSGLSAGLLLLTFYPLNLTRQFKFNIRQRRYMLSIVLSGLCLYGLAGADNWLLAAFEGKSSLAIYFAAGQFALITSLAIEPFRMWWFPRRFKVYEEQPNVAGKFAVIGIQLQIIMISGMLMLGPWVMSHMLPPSYHASQDLLPFLCLIVLFRAYADFLNLGCYYQHDARYVPAINGVCAFLALIIGYLVLPHFGVFGLISVFICIMACRALLFLIVSQALSPINYPVRALLLANIILAVQFGLARAESLTWLMPLMIVWQLALVYRTINPRSSNAFSLDILGVTRAN